MVHARNTDQPLAARRPGEPCVRFSMPNGVDILSGSEPNNGYSSISIFPCLLLCKGKAHSLAVAVSPDKSR
jgi:hypothetical protein